MSILQEAFGDDDPSDDPNVQSVLGAVVLAVNPLSPSTIAALLGFDLDVVYTLLSSVHSLLRLQEDVDQPVPPFHKSFPDFIVDQTRCANPRFRVCPPDQHEKLLVGCLELMNQRLEQNMCKLPDGVANSEVDNLKGRAEKHIDKALEYACRSWHKHLIDKMPARALEILDRFLKEKFLFWLEVLSVVDAVRGAVDALEATTKLLGVRCISLLVHLQRFNGPGSGVINSRPCQRLFSFCNRVLRPHQHVRTTYLPLCASPIPPKIDGLRDVQAIRTSLGKDCAWVSGLVGTSCYSRTS
jgi:hypothetical protein